MTDLIKRLREFHMPVAPTACCGGKATRPIIHPDICDEAADVIEGLYGSVDLVQELRDFCVAVQEYAIHPAVCDEAALEIENWHHRSVQSMQAHEQGRSQSVQEILEELKV